MAVLTDRLYYKDPDVMEFDAVVVGTGRRDTGWYVVLDRSAFYPTSGGQSYDTGHLNGVPVIDVIETSDGDIWHVVAQEVGPVGAKVHGVVDKARRQRNRQNHTAQHILSAAFHRLYGYRTMSVHLGDEYGAVELGADSIDAGQLSEIEATANQVIADNVPVEIMFVDSRSIDSLPLRKEPQREGELRVIRIGDFDYSACGGTHCRTSGGVGLIKIIGAEKIRGRVLVKYLAGKLAVDDYVMRFEVTDSLGRSLTCHPSDLSERVAKISAENESLRRRLADAQRELLPSRAAALSQNAAEFGKCKAVIVPVAGYDVNTVSRLAGLIADNLGGVAALFVDGRLVIATAQASGLHAGNIAKTIAASLKLKGGGNERAAQLGGAVEGDLDKYKSSVRSILENA